MHSDHAPKGFSKDCQMGATCHYINLVCWMAYVNSEGVPAQIAALAADMLKNNPETSHSACGGGGHLEPIVELSADAMRLLRKNGVALHLPGFIAILIALYSTYRVARSCFMPNPDCSQY